MNDSLHAVCPHCAAVNRLPKEKLTANPVCGQCKAAIFTGTPTELDSRTFSRFIERNDLPVVVDFWAPWCGPCRMMAPHFEQAAQQLEPSIRFAKVNTEAAQDLAGRFNIRSIPTLAIFRDGKEIARQSGALDANSLKRWLTPYLIQT